MVNIQEINGVKMQASDELSTTCTVVILSIGNQIEPLVFAESVSKKVRREVTTKRVMEYMEAIHKSQEKVSAEGNAVQAIGPKAVESNPPAVAGEDTASNH